MYNHIKFKADVIKFTNNESYKNNMGHQILTPIKIYLPVGFILILLGVNIFQIVVLQLHIRCHFSYLFVLSIYLLLIEVLYINLFYLSGGKCMKPVKLVTKCCA
jgi:hypothetical protein